MACPAISTVHAVLDRNGLVKRRRRRIRPRLTGTTLSQPLAPNVLWCADYKGEFLLANHRYCYRSRSRTFNQGVPGSIPGRPTTKRVIGMELRHR